MGESVVRDLFNNLGEWFSNIEERIRNNEERIDEVEEEVRIVKKHNATKPSQLDFEERNDVAKTYLEEREEVTTYQFLEDKFGMNIDEVDARGSEYRRAKKSLEEVSNSTNGVRPKRYTL